MSSDWLPPSRTEQLVMAKNWQGVLLKKGEEWAVSAGEIVELKESIEDAQSILDIAISNKRTAEIDNQIRKSFSRLTTCMEDMKDTKLTTPPLCMEDIINMGLLPRIPVSDPPKGRVGADVSCPGKSLLLLHIVPILGVAKGDTEHGFRIFHGVMPEGGASAEEAQGPQRYLTRPPQSHDFKNKKNKINKN